MLIALDTNFLVYAEGVGDAERCGRAREIVSDLPTDRVIIPAQVMGELFRVLVGKAGRPAADARRAVFSWADSFQVVDSRWGCFAAAFDLTVDHSLSVWDALILSVAAENQCRILLSEDMQSGFVWRGTTVVNPFNLVPDPLLKMALSL